MHVILKNGKVVGGPYASHAEALAQAFEKGAIEPNPGYRFPPFTKTGGAEPLYKESHVFAGWEIAEAD